MFDKCLPKFKTDICETILPRCSDTCQPLQSCKSSCKDLQKECIPANLVGMLSQVLPGGSFRSMIGMVGLSEGSPAMKMLDAWVGKMSKCESPLLSKSNDVCLTSDYNKKACDPTSLPVKDEEPKKDEPTTPEASIGSEVKPEIKEPEAPTTPEASIVGEVKPEIKEPQAPTSEDNQNLSVQEATDTKEATGSATGTEESTGSATGSVAHVHNISRIEPLSTSPDKDEDGKDATPDETKADHKETALSDCCHHKWGKSSLLVRCLANPKRFHCAKKDRTAYLGKGHGKDLLKKILDRIDRMDTRLNHVHNVVRSIHAKHGSGKSGVLDEESGITLSEH